MKRDNFQQMSRNNLLNFSVKYSKCRMFYTDKTSIFNGILDNTLVIVISTSQQKSDCRRKKKIE